MGRHAKKPKPFVTLEAALEQAAIENEPFEPQPDPDTPLTATIQYDAQSPIDLNAISQEELDEEELKAQEQAKQANGLPPNTIPDKYIRRVENCFNPAPENIVKRPKKGFFVETGEGGRGRIPGGSRGIIDKPYEDFIKTMDLDELKGALAFADSTKAQDFLSALLSPKFKNWSMSTIAKHHGIGIPQLRAIWRDHKLAQAMQKFTDAAPEVAADIAEDAKSSRVVCSRCDGYGVIKQEPEYDVDGCIIPTTPNQCPQCQGRGWMRKPGDSDARKLMLETIGFAGKRAPLIQTNVTNITSVESVIEELDRTVRGEGAVDVEYEEVLEQSTQP